MLHCRRLESFNIHPNSGYNSAAVLDPPFLDFSLQSKTYPIPKSTASTMKMIAVLSASVTPLAGTVVGQAVPVDAFYCPLKPDLLGACCEKYVEADTVGHYCASTIFRFREQST
jgi:hypothetical protein